MPRNDGGPAFPVIEGLVDRHPNGRAYDAISIDGMSLRAGQALAGIVGVQYGPEVAEQYDLSPEGVAKGCYAIADAMLAERER